MRKYLGIVTIPKNKAGLVFRKRGKTVRHSVSIHNEAGYQAELLPVGEYYNYWKWKYKIELIDPIYLNSNEIALVIAKDGKDNDGVINLGKHVGCDDFQDAKSFLINGGQKGRQLQILRKEGKYFINPELFTVITKSNCEEYNVSLSSLVKLKIPNGQIGIVTILSGEENDFNEISSVDKKLHNSYQNPTEFYKHGGKKGLQEEVLTPGEYDINPWFAEVELAPITEIPTGAVGVIVSHTGKSCEEAESVSGVVKEGFRGVVEKPLFQGKYAINLETKTIHLIPTMDITLEWSPESKKTSTDNYDIDLKPIILGTSDGFDITLEVSQTIKIIESEAPKLISRISANESVDLLVQNNKKNIRYPAVKSLINKIIKASVQPPMSE